MMNATVQLSALLMTSPVKIVHYVVSICFLVFAVLLIFRSITGLIKKREFGKLDKFLSYAFIVNLYLQLIFGIVLFANLNPTSGLSYPGDSSNVEMLSKRLWPIEHIVLMLFALFIANLGLISSLKSKSSSSKYRKVLIYYVLSIVLIAYSLISIYL
jgi:heme A synthase